MYVDGTAGVSGIGELANNNPEKNDRIVLTDFMLTPRRRGVMGLVIVPVPVSVPLVCPDGDEAREPPVTPELSSWSHEWAEGAAP